MSHFTVLVIGQDPEKQLQPFHQYECTDTNDQYVQDVDQTAENRAEYETATASMVKVPAGAIVTPNTYGLATHPVHGTLVSRYADIFKAPNPEYDENVNFFSRAPETIFHLPDGYEEMEVPKKEIMTFLEFVQEDHSDRAPIPLGQEPDREDKDQWGYVLLDENGDVAKVVRRTNPNYKWDWYSLGGRWSGFFKMKPGASAVVGRPGLMTPKAEDGTADQAFKVDIDFDGMRADAEAKAAVKYDAIRAIIEPHLPATPWPELRAKYQGETPEFEGGIEAARNAYHEQPAVKALAGAEEYRWEDIEPFLAERAEHIRLAGLQSCSTFAVLKDGVWHERGSMGWWGCVSDEKDTDTWLTELGKLVAELPDDTLLSIYDCHI